MKAKELIERCKAGKRDFQGVDLSKADLNSARLNGADLSRANLSDADLSQAKQNAPVHTRGAYPDQVM